jgi:Tol biopolymer transport system component
MHPFRALLAIADVATGELTRVGELATGRLYRSSRWSPDRRTNVFTADRYSCDNGCDLYGGSAVTVIRRRGDGWSAPKAITDVGRYGPADWHPTKDLILFGDRDIRGVAGTDYPPTHLYTVRSDGSKRTRLKSFRSAERPSGPTWTPDGRIMVTLVTVEERARGIALLNADGSGLRVVVPDAAVGRWSGGARMRPR